MYELGGIAFYHFSFHHCFHFFLTYFPKPHGERGKGRESLGELKI
jgi:hypothetical protein